MAMKVRGYASIFGNRDNHGEVIDRGAFGNWIKSNPDTPIDIYWQHNHDGGWNRDSIPVGITTKIKQDRKGLYFEGVINDTAKGLDVQAFLVTHGQSGASFGFRTIDKYQKKEVWHLTDLELREVTVAARFLASNEVAYVEAIPEPEGDA